MTVDPFIVSTIPKISVVPATPESTTFRNNKNEDLDITSQSQNSIRERNDNHLSLEVMSSKNYYYFSLSHMKLKLIIAFSEIYSQIKNEVCMINVWPVLEMALFVFKKCYFS